jgi:hypothetical protein
MQKTFFPCTRNTVDSLTKNFDFLWPTAAALWNLRWQVNGFVAATPNANETTIAGRFISGSGITGANLKRACIAHTWEDQQERLAEILLTSVFAIYESWCEEILKLLHLSQNNNAKKLQFPTEFDANGNIVSGVQRVLSISNANQSLMMNESIFPMLAQHPKYSLASIENQLTCYRYFKEARNCLMHNGGIADHKCVDAYARFAAIPDAASLGVAEIPNNSGAVLQQRVGLSLRGVVGLSDIVLRLIITLDAQFACHSRAEQFFFEIWRSEIQKGLNMPVNPALKSERLRGFVRSLGWQCSPQTERLELLLKEQHLWY